MYFLFIFFCSIRFDSREAADRWLHRFNCKLKLPNDPKGLFAFRHAAFEHDAMSLQSPHIVNEDVEGIYPKCEYMCKELGLP